MICLKDNTVNSSFFNKTIKFINTFVRKIVKDDVPGMSAQLSFYLILTFFPLLILIFTLISFSPLLTEDLLYDVLSALPDQTVSLVWKIITGVTRSPSILISSAIIAMWSASAAMSTVAKAMNRFYGIREERNFIFVRLTGMVFVAAIVVLIILSFTIIVFGSLIGDAISSYSPNYLPLWQILRLTVLLTCSVTIFIMIFKKMPNKQLKFKYLWQGSVFTTIAWVLGSLVFSFYVNNFSSYHVIYGSIAGLIALVTWLYMSAYIILLGGELNSVIYSEFIEKQKEKGYGHLS